MKGRNPDAADCHDAEHQPVIGDHAPARARPAPARTKPMGMSHGFDILSARWPNRGWTSEDDMFVAKTTAAAAA